MPTLGQAFTDEDCRVTKAVVAIDLTDSTSLKERDAEASWLTTYAWFFDQLDSTIKDDGGRIVKFLGDGAMAIFDRGRATEAINWAIKVQEVLDDARSHKRTICECSIGIAYGTMVEFDTPEGAKDYIGTTVDKAFRLCSAANARGIFVDTKTVQAAGMDAITSIFGRASRWRRRIIKALCNRWPRRASRS